MILDPVVALTSVLSATGGGLVGYGIFRLHEYLNKVDPVGEPPAGHWAPSGEIAVFVPDEAPIEVTIYAQDFIDNPTEHEFGNFVKTSLLQSGVPIDPLSQHPDYLPLRGNLEWRYSNDLGVVVYRWTPQ